MRKRIKRIGLGAAVTCLIAALFMGTVSAQITATAGEVHKAPPPASVALNQHEHADSGKGDGPFGAHAFEEEQDYVTKAPVLLDVCTTNT